MPEGTATIVASDAEPRVIFQGPASAVALIGPAFNGVVKVLIAVLLFSSERLWQRVETAPWSGALTAQLARASVALQPAISNLVDTTAEVRKAASNSEPNSTVSPAALIFGGLKWLGWLFILLALLHIIKAAWMWLATRYLLTTHRIEIERGILSKHILNLELWRVKDICYSRSFWDFFFQVGRLRVIAADEVMPDLHIGPIPGARSVYDQLKHARLMAGQRAGAQAMGVAS
jgi:membrane protein YdbS with pleckstrin-like domain